MDRSPRGALSESRSSGPTASRSPRALASRARNMSASGPIPVAKAVSSAPPWATATAPCEQPVYLDLVTRGLLWACGKLGEDGKPLPGYGPGQAVALAPPLPHDHAPDGTALRCSARRGEANCPLVCRGDFLPMAGPDHRLRGLGLRCVPGADFQYHPPPTARGYSEDWRDGRGD